MFHEEERQLPRRIEIVGPGCIELREYARPVMRPGCVRFEIAYCSVNRADIERVRGSYGGVSIADAAFSKSGDGASIPGYEPAGWITEAASDVAGDVVGRAGVLHSHTACGRCVYCREGMDNLCTQMRVFGAATPGIGGWSEEVVVPVEQVMPLPDSADLPSACTYEVTYGTALHSLRRGWEIAKRGGPVGIRGIPGGVALAAAQLCILLDTPCFGIVRHLDGHRTRQVRELLPELVLVGEQFSTEEIVTSIGDVPMVVIEPLGGSYVSKDVALVGHGGAVGVLGGHLGVESSLRWDEIFHKGVAIYGTPRAPMQTMLEVADLVGTGSVRPVVDRIFPMAEAKNALEYCDKPTGVGRVLLSMK